MINHLQQIEAFHEQVILQSGTSNLQTPGVIRYTFLSHSSFSSLLKQARVVITHAGPGTIYECLRLGKKPIVVARTLKFNEHVSEHQTAFAQDLVKQKRIFLASNESDIVSHLKQHSFKQRKLPRQSVLVKKLLHYFSNI